MARIPRTGRKTGASAPGRLRIVAGKWRGRLLPVTDVDGLRPTPARVRETLFNWLAPHIEGARCLDLCAGTGALGFEALSRGAVSATFIENSPTAVAALRAAAGVLQADAADIRETNAVSYLTSPATTRFHMVFVDPPYASGLQEELCRLLNKNGWLADKALVYVEQPRNNPPLRLPESWQPTRDKTAGNVRYLLVSAGAGQ